MKPSSDGIGGASKHGKRYPLIFWVKKPVELRSTGVQPLRHLGLADVLLFHRLFKLTRELLLMACSVVSS